MGGVRWWGGCEGGGVGGGRPPRRSRRLLNELRAFEQFARDVLARVGLRDEPFQPRPEAIDPRFDGVLVLARRGDGEGPLPAIVVARDERDFEPCRVRLARHVWRVRKDPPYGGASGGASRVG